MIEIRNYFFILTIESKRKISFNCEIVIQNRI